MMKRKSSVSYGPRKKAKTRKVNYKKARKAITGKKIKISPVESKGIKTKYQYQGSYSSGTFTAPAQPWLALGTTTCPQRDMLTTISLAILKTLMTKGGIVFQAATETILATALNDKLEATYQLELGETMSNSTVFTAAGPFSLLTAATALTTFITGTLKPGSTFLTLKFVPTNTQEKVVSIDINRSWIDISCSAQLNIQNVSVPSAVADDENADEVDAVHLSGTSYEGYGTGTFVQPSFGQSENSDGPDIGLWADVGGIISRRNTNDQIQVLPPPGEQLLYAKKYKKVFMPAGSIMKNQQFSKFKMNLQYMITKMLQIRQQSASPIFFNSVKMGKFFVVMLQRHIEPSVTAPVTINVNYRFNWDFNAIVTEPKKKVVNQVTFVNDVTINAT